MTQEQLRESLTRTSLLAIECTKDKIKTEICYEENCRGGVRNVIDTIKNSKGEDTYILFSGRWIVQRCLQNAKFDCVVVSSESEKIMLMISKRKLPDTEAKKLNQEELLDDSVYADVISFAATANYFIDEQSKLLTLNCLDIFNQGTIQDLSHDYAVGRDIHGNAEQFLALDSDQKIRIIDKRIYEEQLDKKGYKYNLKTLEEDANRYFKNRFHGEIKCHDVTVQPQNHDSENVDDTTGKTSEDGAASGCLSTIIICIIIYIIVKFVM